MVSFCILVRKYRWIRDIPQHSTWYVPCTMFCHFLKYCMSMTGKHGKIVFANWTNSPFFLLLTVIIFFCSFFFIFYAFDSFRNKLTRYKGLLFSAQQMIKIVKKTSDITHRLILQGEQTSHSASCWSLFCNTSWNLGVSHDKWLGLYLLANGQQASGYLFSSPHVTPPLEKHPDCVMLNSHCLLIIKVWLGLS